MPLYKKVNFLGKNKSCCEHVIKNFRNDCAWSSFTILVLEISAGTSHTNRKVCSVQRGKRFTKEDYRMKTIRAIYLYGVSGKATKHMIVKYQLENLLFFIYRAKQWFPRNRNNIGYLKCDTMKVFFTKINSIDCMFLSCHVRVSE